MNSSIKGIALLEVTIAAGMLGLISLGVMSLNNMMTKSSGEAEKKLDRLSFSNELTYYTDIRNCTGNFKGLTFEKSTMAGGQDISLYKIDASGAKTDLKYCSGTNTICNTTGKYNISSLKYYLEDKNPVDFPASPLHYAEAYLEIILSPINQSTGNAETKLKHKMKFLLKTDASGLSTINQCWGTATLDENTVKKIACDMNNEGYDTNVQACDGIKVYSTGSLAGGGGGGVADFICPPGSSISKVYGKEATWPAGMAAYWDVHFECSSYVRIDSIIYKTAVTATSQAFGSCPAPCVPSATPFLIECPSNQWVTGIKVNSGDSHYVYKIAFLCSDGSTVVGNASANSKTDCSTSAKGRGVLAGVRVRNGWVLDGLMPICL